MKQRAKGMSMYCQWKGTIIPPLWKTTGQQLVRVKMLYDLEIPFLGILSRRTVKYTHLKTWIEICTAVLFVKKKNAIKMSIKSKMDKYMGCYIKGQYELTKERRAN